MKITELFRKNSLVPQNTCSPEHEAQVRFHLEKLRRDEYFEARVCNLKRLILANHKFDWPYTDAFDDGGYAIREARRRIADELSLLRNCVDNFGYCELQ